MMLLHKILNILFFLWLSRGFMISSTLDIWTYTISDHHFHLIFSGLINFVTPVVFPVKIDQHMKWMGNTRLCSFLKFENIPMYNHTSIYTRAVKSIETQKSIDTKMLYPDTILKIHCCIVNGLEWGIEGDGIWWKVNCLRWAFHLSWVHGFGSKRWPPFQQNSSTSQQGCKGNIILKLLPSCLRV